MNRSKTILGSLASAAALITLATQDGRAIAANGSDACRQMISQQIQNQLTYRRTVAEQRESQRFQDADEKAMDAELAPAAEAKPEPLPRDSGRASREAAKKDAPKSGSGPTHYS